MFPFTAIMPIDYSKWDYLIDESSDENSGTISQFALLVNIMRACTPSGLAHHAHMSAPIHMYGEFMSIRVHTCVPPPDVL